MKQWVRPQLIVLTRGQPEETLLLGCKVQNPPTSGPIDGFATCMTQDGGLCESCSQALGS